MIRLLCGSIYLKEHISIIIVCLKREVSLLTGMVVSVVFTS